MNVKRRLIAILMSFAITVAYMPMIAFAEGSADHGFTPSAEETQAKAARDSAQ